MRSKCRFDDDHDRWYPHPCKREWEREHDDDYCRHDYDDYERGHRY